MGDALEQHGKIDFYRELAETEKFGPSDKWEPDPTALEHLFRLTLDPSISHELDSQRSAVDRAKMASDVVSSLEATWKLTVTAAAHEDETLWGSAERGYGELMSLLLRALAEATDIADVASEVVQQIQGGNRKPEHFLKEHGGKLSTDLGCLLLWRALKALDVPYVDYYGAGMAYYMGLDPWDLPPDADFPKRDLLAGQALDRFRQRVNQAKRYLRDYFPE